ncbi:MAG: hypothetical protein QMD21_07675 [Candidatus Thermoplasmatota archaeon]|nr:hypothetical protein [Candidatus Thermoplasmatota archaeon]
MGQIKKASIVATKTLKIKKGILWLRERKKIPLEVVEDFEWRLNDFERFINYIIFVKPCPPSLFEDL